MTKKGFIEVANTVCHIINRCKLHNKTMSRFQQDILIDSMKEYCMRNDTGKLGFKVNKFYNYIYEGIGREL